MKLENIIKLKFNNFEIKAPAKKEVYADYQWEQCIADQIDRYGDEEIAKKVCGAIKAGMQRNFAEGDSLEGSCWEGYEPIGLKPSADGSRMVPNCVPIKENQSKENFVIPSPNADESESDFMGRCISPISDEYEHEQSIAICIGKWKGE